MFCIFHPGAGISSFFLTNASVYLQRVLPLPSFIDASLKIGGAPQLVLFPDSDLFHGAYSPGNCGGYHACICWRIPFLFPFFTPTRWVADEVCGAGEDHCEKEAVG